MYVQVVVDAGSASMFDAYTYSVPESLEQSVTPGSCVLAPLGPREVIGYVVGYESTAPEVKIRDIISVVDSFHAIVSSRCYREGRSIDSAIHEIRNCAGTQFDPIVVDAFLRALKKELQKKGEIPSSLVEYASS